MPRAGFQLADTHQLPMRMFTSCDEAVEWLQQMSISDPWICFAVTLSLRGCVVRAASRGEVTSRAATGPRRRSGLARPVFNQGLPGTATPGEILTHATPVSQPPLADRRHGQRNGTGAKSTADQHRGDERADRTKQNLDFKHAPVRATIMPTRFSFVRGDSRRRAVLRRFKNETQSRFTMVGRKPSPCIESTAQASVGEGPDSG
jgi:hypothetical protein